MAELPLHEAWNRGYVIRINRPRSYTKKSIKFARFMCVSMYLQSQLVSNLLYFYKSLEMLFSAKVIEHMYVLRTRIVNTFF
jgi:hypothetical protein